MDSVRNGTSLTQPTGGPLLKSSLTIRSTRKVANSHSAQNVLFYLQANHLIVCDNNGNGARWHSGESGATHTRPTKPRAVSDSSQSNATNTCERSAYVGAVAVISIGTPLTTGRRKRKYITRPDACCPSTARGVPVSRRHQSMGSGGCSDASPCSDLDVSRASCPAN